jgi:hypothetical protein
MLARLVLPVVCKALVEAPVVLVAIVAREVFPVVCRALVDAPEGNPTVRVLFGLTATTRAGSVAVAAVLAALTAAVFVPSLIFVVWLPTVV